MKTTKQRQSATLYDDYRDLDRVKMFQCFEFPQQWTQVEREGEKKRSLISTLNAFRN